MFDRYHLSGRQEIKNKCTFPLKGDMEWDDPADLGKRWVERAAQMYWLIVWVGLLKLGQVQM